MTNKFGNITVKQENPLILDTSTVLITSDSETDSLFDAKTIDFNVSEYKDSILSHPQLADTIQNKGTNAEQPAKKIEPPVVHRKTGTISVANFRRRRLLSTSVRSYHNDMHNGSVENENVTDVLVMTNTQPTSNEIESTVQISPNQLSQSSQMQALLTPMVILKTEYVSVPSTMVQLEQQTPFQSQDQNTQPQQIQVIDAQSMPNDLQQQTPPPNPNTFCAVCCKQLKTRKTFSSHKRTQSHFRNQHLIQQLIISQSQPNADSQ